MGKKQVIRFVYPQYANMRKITEVDGKVTNISEYNDQGLEVYSKDSEGVEVWQEYNDQGLNTSWKNSKGSETISEYDKSGQVTHWKSTWVDKENDTTTTSEGVSEFDEEQREISYTCEDHKETYRYEKIK